LRFVFFLDVVFDLQLAFARHEEAVADLCRDLLLNLFVYIFFFLFPALLGLIFLFADISELHQLCIIGQGLNLSHILTMPLAFLNVSISLRIFQTTPAHIFCQISFFLLCCQFSFFEFGESSIFEFVEKPNNFDCF